MHVAWLQDLRMKDLPQVGGKNASLGEMIGELSQTGIRVPGGFATTAEAYREFLRADGLDQRIARRIADLKTSDVQALARCGAEIRGWIEQAPFPKDLENAISSYYQELVKSSSSDISFAIRSSATAEDLPDASFAGQQETYLNVHGLDNVLHAVRHVFASLYNDRAISYRAHHGFAHGEVANRVVVERFRLVVDAVGHEVVHAAAEVDRRTVREVAALVEAHAHHLVARFEQRHERRHVRIRTRMRLHVRDLGAKQLARAVARKVFGVVNVGYLFALSQFFMAWLLAWAYVRAAGRFDKMARDVVEKGR